MQPPHRSGPRSRPPLALLLLASFLGVLWIAGGASRADAPGQFVVRIAATLALIAAFLLADRPSLHPVRPVAWLLAAALVLALVQLVPLPPDVWRALPGRDTIARAADVSGQAQPWRPWSIVPGATLNAASSLIVPIATLVLTAGLDDRERRWLPGVMLVLVATAMLVGLLQFSGIRIGNPFINDTPGEVGGIFANRNHFALFLAMGCLVAPVWAFSEGRSPQWRGPVALGLVLLFVLTILATGSRAGLGLGVLALGLGYVLARQGIRRALRRYPRWAFPVLVASIVGALALFVVLSVAADRAVSIDRVIAVDPGRDMRGRGLPTVLAMIRSYFPVGSGLGTFDPMFRMHEPFALLKLTYFNHAHDDYLEILLDAGIPGLLLLAAALLWWARASVRTWRGDARAEHVLPRLGSAMLLLVFLASAFDYPARTPTMMATIVIAALWLAEGGRRGLALPAGGQHL